MNDERVVAAERFEHGGENLGVFRCEHADEMIAGSGWVGQRPEQVEDGSHFERAADGAGEAHGGVHLLREEETDPVFLYAAFHDGWFNVEIESEFGEHIRGSGFAGDRAVAVFGDRDSGARCNEAGGRGNVEGPERVASGSDDIQNVGHSGVDEGGFLSHGARGSGDFRNRFAFQAQHGEEGCNLDVGAVALHDAGEAFVCFLFLQVAVRHEFIDIGTEHFSVSLH